MEIGLKHIYFKSNIHGNYNLFIVIYINIIGSERKHYSLFGSSPKIETDADASISVFVTLYW